MDKQPDKAEASTTTLNEEPVIAKMNRKKSLPSNRCNDSPMRPVKKHANAAWVNINLKPLQKVP